MAKAQHVFDAPIGGESWQYEPRSMPWDRPARFHETDAALDYIFRRLRNPVMSKKLLNLLQAGMPLDMLAEMLITQGFSQGQYQAPVLMQMVAPLVAILFRMCESAGIQPKLTTDKDLQPVDFDPADMLAAEKRISNNDADKAMHANEISDKELKKPNLADRAGFMKFRPKAKSK